MEEFGETLVESVMECDFEKHLSILPEFYTHEKTSFNSYSDCAAA